MAFNFERINYISCGGAFPQETLSSMNFSFSDEFSFAAVIGKLRSELEKNTAVQQLIAEMDAEDAEFDVVNRVFTTAEGAEMLKYNRDAVELPEYLDETEIEPIVVSATIDDKWVASAVGTTQDIAVDVLTTAIAEQVVCAFSDETESLPLTLAPYGNKTMSTFTPVDIEIGKDVKHFTNVMECMCAAVEEVNIDPNCVRVSPNFFSSVRMNVGPPINTITGPGEIKVILPMIDKPYMSREMANSILAQIAYNNGMHMTGRKYGYCRECKEDVIMYNHEFLCDMTEINRIMSKYVMLIRGDSDDEKLITPDDYGEFDRTMNHEYDAGVRSVMLLHDGTVDSD